MVEEQKSGLTPVPLFYGRIRARLATRFNLGDVQVKAMLSNFDSPADVYIVKPE
jgi:hypothetical protein